MISFNLDLKKGDYVRNTGRIICMSFLGVFTVLGIALSHVTAPVIRYVKRSWSNATITPRNVSGGCYR